VARPRLTDMQRSHRMSWTLIGLTVALGLVATACGTRPAPAGPAASRNVTSYTVASRGGPPQGSRAASLALASKLLRQLRRPPGSRVVRPRPVPKNLRGPAQGMAVVDQVDVKRFYSAPRSMAASYAYLRKHVPAGYRRTVTGSQGQDGRTVLELVVDNPKALPRAVEEADLVVGVVPGRHGGSVLRADGEVAWYPPRSAAERLRPAAYRAVTITRTSLNGHRATRTFRSRAAIARLARVLDSLPASDGGSFSCPSGPGFRLAFRPKAGQPRFVVTADGCATDLVTVAGRDQPVLADPRERVVAAAQRLLSGRAH
jgi:hypothetical protein